MATSLATLGGCDAISTKEKVARDLYKRVLQHDCFAFFELQDRRDRNEVPAAKFLGLAIQQHLGSECRQDDLVALRAYGPAAGKSQEVDFNIGLILLGRKSYPDAEKALISAAGGDKRNGLRRAMVKLAQIYDAGLAGFPNSDSLAAQYFSAAADRGDLYAQTRLAKSMIEGRGVPRNLERAIELLDHAAQKGNRDARMELYRLAEMGLLANGKPLPEVAAKWLGAAAVVDASLLSRYTAYLNRLNPSARATVAQEVAFFSEHMRERWIDDEYDQPIAPASLRNEVRQ